MQKALQERSRFAQEASKSVPRASKSAPTARKKAPRGPKGSGRASPWAIRGQSMGDPWAGSAQWRRPAEEGGGGKPPLESGRKFVRYLTRRQGAADLIAPRIPPTPLGGLDDERLRSEDVGKGQKAKVFVEAKRSKS